MAETFVARVIADGRVTIPEYLRELFRVKEGDLVRVTLIEKVENKEPSK